MNIRTISVTKSRTSGTAASNKMKFNKIVITMEASLEPEDDHEAGYRALSKAVDDALDYEMTPPASVLNNQ